MSKFNFKEFDIAGKKQLWYIIPLVIILIAVIVFLSVGLSAGNVADGINIGIDFQGGTQLTIALGDGAEGDAYNENVKILTDIIENNREIAPKVSKVQRVTEGGISSIRIKYKNVIEDGDEMNKLNETIRNDIYKYYGKKPSEDLSFVTIGSTSKTATSTLFKKALLAAGISIVAILLYIIFRFEWLSGISAVLALLHDVVIMFAFTIIFQIQINSAYVAAVITIIAYSINNTIVVFDRVRERKKLIEKGAVDYASVANDAIIMTLSRTMFTSATTMIMVIFLTILGVPTMREFTLPILFGLIAGTYSSMFLAAPTWALMNQSLAKKRAKQKTSFKKK